MSIIHGPESFEPLVFTIDRDLLDGWYELTPVPPTIRLPLTRDQSLAGAALQRISISASGNECRLLYRLSSAHHESLTIQTFILERQNSHLTFPKAPAKTFHEANGEKRGTETGMEQGRRSGRRIGFLTGAAGVALLCALSHVVRRDHQPQTPATKRAPLAPNIAANVDFFEQQGMIQEKARELWKAGHLEDALKETNRALVQSKNPRQRESLLQLKARILRDAEKFEEAILAQEEFGRMQTILIQPEPWRSLAELYEKVDPAKAQAWRRISDAIENEPLADPLRRAEIVRRIRQLLGK